MKYLLIVILFTVIILSGCVGAPDSKTCTSDSDCLKPSGGKITYCQKNTCHVSSGIACKTDSDCPDDNNVYYCRADIYNTWVCIAYNANYAPEVKDCKTDLDCDDGNKLTNDICSKHGSIISVCVHIS